MTKVIENTYDKEQKHIFFDTTQHSAPSFVPIQLSDFIGQEVIKKRVELYIASAQKRKLPLDHILFFGPPGLGKTTLIEIIALTMGRRIKQTSGPLLAKTADIIALLSALKEGDILFIDEIHRLQKKVEEVLYSAMEQYRIDIVLGAGTAAKTVSLKLPPFTLLGATTKLGMLSKPLQSRFGIIERFVYYTPSDLQAIILQTAHFFSMSLSCKAALAIAEISRGTPRIAKKIVAKVRDYAVAREQKYIDEKILDDVFVFFGILPSGMTKEDLAILRVLYEAQYPIGLDYLSSLIDEEKETIEELYEPFLLQKGFIERTPRGRILREEQREVVARMLQESA
jgi:Holliday junction DNA helicase RuvB